MLCLLLFAALFKVFACSFLNAFDKAIQEIVGEEVAKNIIFKTDTLTETECASALEALINMDHNDELKYWERLSLANKSQKITVDCKRYEEQKDAIENALLSLEDKLIIPLKNENEYDDEEEVEEINYEIVDMNEPIKGFIKGQKIYWKERLFQKFYTEVLESKKDENDAHDFLASFLADSFDFLKIGRFSEHETRLSIVPKILKFGNKGKCELGQEIMKEIDECIKKRSAECLKKIKAKHLCIDAKLLFQFWDYEAAASIMGWLEYPKEAEQEAKEWVESLSNSSKVIEKFTHDICNPDVWKHLYVVSPDKWQYITTFNNILLPKCEAGWDVFDRITALNLSNAFETWPENIKETISKGLAKEFNTANGYQSRFQLPKSLLALTLNEIPFTEILRISPIPYLDSNWFTFIFENPVINILNKTALLYGIVEKNNYFDFINYEFDNNMEEDDVSKFVWLVAARRIISKSDFGDYVKLDPDVLNQFVGVFEEFFEYYHNYKQAFLDVSSFWEDATVCENDELSSEYGTIQIRSICKARESDKKSLKSLYKAIADECFACKKYIVRLHQTFKVGYLGNKWMGQYITSFLNSLIIPSKQREVLQACVPFLFTNLTSYRHCLEKYESSVPLSALDWFHKIIFDDGVISSKGDDQTLFDLRNAVKISQEPRIDGNFDLNHVKSEGTEQQREFLIETNDFINSEHGTADFLNSKLLVLFAEGTDFGGLSRHLVSTLLSGLANPTFKLMKNIGKRVYIPELFLSGETAFAMGVIYAKTFLMGQQPATSLAPEFLDLLMDPEDHEKIEKFYLKYYPLNTIEEWIAKKDIETFLDVQLATFSTLSNLLIPSNGKLSDVTLNEIHEYGELTFYTVVKEFHKGLAKAVKLDLAPFIQPISRFYNLFTAPELTFETLWPKIEIIDQRDPQPPISSFVKGQSLSVEDFIKSMIQSLNSKELLRFVQQTTGSNTLSMNPGEKISIIVMNPEKNAVLYSPPHICALLPAVDGSELQKKAFDQFAKFGTVEDLKPLKELFGEETKDVVSHILYKAQDLNLEGAFITPRRYIELVRAIALKQHSMLAQNYDGDLELPDPFDPNNPTVSDGSILGVKISTCSGAVTFFYYKYPGEFTKQIRFLENPLSDFFDS